MNSLPRVKGKHTPRKVVKRKQHKQKAKSSSWSPQMATRLSKTNRSLHVIVDCPSEQGTEDLIVLFILQKAEPLAVPRFDPFRFLLL